MAVSSFLVCHFPQTLDFFSGCFKKRKRVVKGARREEQKKNKTGGRKGKEQESGFQEWCIEEVTRNKPKLSKVPTILTEFCWNRRDTAKTWIAYIWITVPSILTWRPLQSSSSRRKLLTDTKQVTDNNCLYRDSHCLSHRPSPCKVYTPPIYDKEKCKSWLLSFNLSQQQGHNTWTTKSALKTFSSVFNSCTILPTL